MVDNSDGDHNSCHNTDAFDVGESNGFSIRNAVVKNQDDCLPVDSGLVSSFITTFLFVREDLYFKREDEELTLSRTMRVAARLLHWCPHH